MFVVGAAVYGDDQIVIEGPVAPHAHGTAPSRPGRIEGRVAWQIDDVLTVRVGGDSGLLLEHGLVVVGHERPIGADQLEHHGGAGGGGAVREGQGAGDLGHSSLLGVAAAFFAAGFFFPPVRFAGGSGRSALPWATSRSSTARERWVS